MILSIKERNKNYFSVYPLCFSYLPLCFSLFSSLFPSFLDQTAMSKASDEMVSKPLELANWCIGVALRTQSKGKMVVTAEPPELTVKELDQQLSEFMAEVRKNKKKNESSNNLSIWWSWYVVGHRIRRSHAWCSRWQPPWLGCKESSRLLSNTRRQFTIVHYAMGCRAWWTKQQLYQTDKGRSCHLLHVWGRRKGKMGFGGSREP